MKYVLVQSPFSQHFMFPRYSKSTSTFCISGNFIEDIAELEDHFHISFLVIDQHMPNLFMHATAIELSVNTFVRTFVRLFAKAFEPNNITTLIKV